MVEKQRKVHFYCDQKGATFRRLGKVAKFANTICKMNSNVPLSHITFDPFKVTCKICLTHPAMLQYIATAKGELKRQAREEDARKQCEKAAETHFWTTVTKNKTHGRSKKAIPSMGEMFPSLDRRETEDAGPATEKKTRYRVNWRGKLILQVADVVPVNFDPLTDTHEPRSFTERWRDAKLEDLNIGVCDGR